MRKGLFYNAAKKFFVSVLIFALCSSVSYSANSGSEGSLTLIVEVKGLLETEETKITVTKESDGELLLFTSMTQNHFATLKIPFGGTMNISAEALPGYEMPMPLLNISLTRIRGNFVMNRTINFIASDIAIESFNIDKTEIKILKGNTETILAEILPVNASVQTVIWSTSNAEIVTVDGGVITAVGYGIAEITAKVEGYDNFTQTCTVEVGQIEFLENPVPINAEISERIQLPAIITAIIDFPSEVVGIESEVPVQWEGVGQSNEIVYYEQGTYFLTGHIIGWSEPIQLEIIINSGPEIIVATDVILSDHILGIKVQETVDLNIITVIPTDANINALKWESTEPAIAKIINNSLNQVTIEGVSPGTTLINVYYETAVSETYPSGKIILDSCIVTVTLSTEIIDVPYIVATEEDSLVGADQFATKADVFIRGYKLTPNEKYYIKVEESGSARVLGTGEYTPENETVVFRLIDYADFRLSTNYSKSYYVSMSKDPNFPSGDYEDGTPKTLKDNFKITSPVPTGLIEVTIVDVTNNNPIAAISEELIGRDVILCREIKDQTALETQYTDYLNNPDAVPQLPLYTDEVKLIGHINSDGTVSWDIPKESLKIGGYILLIDLPDTYDSTLNYPNTVLNDGTLLKEVHISRNTITSVTVEVIKIQY